MGVDAKVRLQLNAANAALARAEYRKTARRILLAPALSSIEAVLGTPPTYTVGSSQTITQNFTYIDTLSPIGGPFGNQATAGGHYCRTQTYTSTPTDGGNGVRYGSHGSGFSFGFYGQAFELNKANFRGNGWTMYVSDPMTGTRYKAQLADYADGSNAELYHKIDFGSVANRGIEIYGNDVTTYFYAMNFANGADVYKWSRREPRVAFVWDSWGAGVVSGGTNLVKLAITDYAGQALNVANPLSLSIGGTGFVSPNGSFTTFGQRIAYGDINQSRIGDLDLVILPASLNDWVYSATGYDPTATAAAAQAAYTAARVAQPNAIIIGMGPQYTNASTPAQGWYDALKAAFLAALPSDPGAIWLDNSAAGENWFNSNFRSTGIPAGNNHVSDTGKAMFGLKMGHSIRAALERMAAVKAYG